ncbi:TetR/AcrR family transcriptional regulator [Planomonospora parontospora]|uniref:TetR/AcrR family transcriptional regulator n=1 Tax=Planomonospora parontospora TaxID=58119 RepID=UPI0016705F8D|nr:TetR/AcrR family transcriptional regulator [Planomonospora parontospora]GGL49011.1 TetR family transcriptional regulator [Planomonospora parontospora subsp. antibiotica]GII18919.1 TetR family transcriptional regulator [Planomonospora parontospora subsp. antibiotica]
MGRSSTARERLLDAACELMLSRGYGSIGVAEICARADVRKGSFYHFFESKQALTIAVVDAHWQAQRSAWTAVLREPVPALDRLERLFREQVEGQRRTKLTAGAVHGCLLANLALELSQQDSPVQERLEEIFAEQVDLVRAALDDAAHEGAIPPPRPSTARSLVAQLEGLVLFAKLSNDPEILNDLWEQARLLLGVADDLSPTA